MSEDEKEYLEAKSYNEFYALLQQVENERKVNTEGRTKEVAN